MENAYIVLHVHYNQSLAVAAIGLVDGDAFNDVFAALHDAISCNFISRRPKLTYVIVATPTKR